MGQTTVGVRLPEEKVAELDRLAGRLNLERSEFMRMIVDMALRMTSLTEHDALPYRNAPRARRSDAKPATEQPVVRKGAAIGRGEAPRHAPPPARSNGHTPKEFRGPLPKGGSRSGAKR
jgi:hypothetical protein